MLTLESSAELPCCNGGTDEDGQGAQAEAESSCNVSLHVEVAEVPFGGTTRSETGVTER